MNFEDLDPIVRQPKKGAKIVDEEALEELGKPETKVKVKTKPENPLKKYFRVPGLSISVPSQNYWYTNDEVSPNINGELDVYPMTAADELNLKNPDALLNGRAIELLIESCVPQVNNVRALVSPDIDAILLAIRAATYGKNMNIETKCPKCQADNEYAVNIASVIDSQDYLDPPYTLQLDDLIIFLKPYTFEAQIKAAIVAFEATKQVRNFTNRNQQQIEENEELKTLLTEKIKKIAEVKFDLISDAITHVICDYDAKTKEGTVVADKKLIREFLENIHKNMITSINDKLGMLNDINTKNRMITATCIKCEHTWETTLDFNPANFFE